MLIADAGFFEILRQSPALQCARGEVCGEQAVISVMFPLEMQLASVTAVHWPK